MEEERYKFYNEYVLVSPEKETSKIKTLETKQWKKVTVLRDTLRFKKDTVLVINPVSMIPYEDDTYFIQEKHIIFKIMPPLNK